MKLDPTPSTQMWHFESVLHNFKSHDSHLHLCFEKVLSGYSSWRRKISLPLLKLATFASASGEPNLRHDITSVTKIFASVEIPVSSYRLSRTWINSILLGSLVSLDVHIPWKRSIERIVDPRTCIWFWIADPLFLYWATPREFHTIKTLIICP